MESNTNKTAFKVVDSSGRILIPRQLRASIGIGKGDVVAISAERGRIVAKKAIVLEDENMTPEAKASYVQAAVREMESADLTELMELIARRVSEINGNI